MPQLARWFAFLAARLRHVRVLNGDWRRAVTTGAAETLPVRAGGVVGVYLDPPYRTETAAGDKNRAPGLYAVDDATGDVADAVAEWAISRGDNPRYRVVVAGMEGEHGDRFERAGWRELEWFETGFLRGGMARLGADRGTNQHRERHWVSPHCLTQATGEPDIGDTLPLF